MDDEHESWELRPAPADAPRKSYPASCCHSIGSSVGTSRTEHMARLAFATLRSECGAVGSAQVNLGLTGRAGARARRASRSRAGSEHSPRE